MTRLRRSIRQTLTIARRDFTATVFTPVFLLFLFAPAIFLGISAIGSFGASRAVGPDDKARIVVVTPDRFARPLAEADTKLRSVLRGDDALPQLTTITERTYAEGQARAAFRSRDYDAVAVMYGPLDKPTVLYGPLGKTAANYLGILAGQALAADRLGGAVPSVTVTKVAMTRERASTSGRNQSAFFAVFGIFFLTLFLAGQVVGTMAEERNNKVIEVLAAAVPLESVFLGKLVGMFGVAVLFVGFWGTIVGKLGSLLPPGAAPALAELTPAVGAPMFALLFAAYFATAYLLLGSVFLGIGAQASTPREIQMLSLPITLVQVGCFALASAAASRPGTPIAMAAEIFPLSSPFAMAGRAANSAVLWPHLLAIAWQLVWVAIFITVGARLFRRGVLQSGSARPFWKRSRTN